MQTPRGFLVGAGVIAAIAAIATIGNPRPQTSVEMASPRPEVEGIVVTPPTMPLPEMPAPSDQIEVRAGASTTAASVELNNAPADRELGAPSSTESTMTAAVTTTPAPQIVDTGARPSVPLEDDGAGNAQPPSAPANPSTAPSTSGAPTTAGAATVPTTPPSSPSTTLPPPATVIVPPISFPAITVPAFPFVPPDLSVPEVAVPPVPISIPTVSALPPISIPVIEAAIGAVEIESLERLLPD